MFFYVGRFIIVFRLSIMIIFVGIYFSSESLVYIFVGLNLISW
jgi:hypothetical protein